MIVISARSLALDRESPQNLREAGILVVPAARPVARLLWADAVSFTCILMTTMAMEVAGNVEARSQRGCRRASR